MRYVCLSDHSHGKTLPHSVAVRNNQVNTHKGLRTLPDAYTPKSPTMTGKTMRRKSACSSFPSTYFRLCKSVFSCPKPVGNTWLSPKLLW